MIYNYYILTKLYLKYIGWIWEKKIVFSFLRMNEKNIIVFFVYTDLFSQNRKILNVCLQKENIFLFLFCDETFCVYGWGWWDYIYMYIHGLFFSLPVRADAHFSLTSTMLYVCVCSAMVTRRRPPPSRAHHGRFFSLAQCTRNTHAREYNVQICGAKILMDRLTPKGFIFLIMLLNVVVVAATAIYVAVAKHFFLLLFCCVCGLGWKMQRVFIWCHKSGWKKFASFTEVWYTHTHTYIDAGKKEINFILPAVRRRGGSHMCILHSLYFAALKRSYFFLHMHFVVCV